MSQTQETKIYDAAPSWSNFVTVKTTLPRRPFPPNSARQPFHTERLTLRPPTKDDLQFLRRLRTQPEVMQWTAAKRIDNDLAETESRLTPFLTPNDALTYNFAICLKETGEFVGIGGFHNGGFDQGEGKSLFGWPEVGYMFLKEFWGKGFGTEFLKGFKELWSKLERETVEGLRVDERSVVRKADGSAEEVLAALTTDVNGRSQGVLRKCGFEEFARWRDEAEGGTGDVLPSYRWCPLREVRE
ncbi:GNAT domain-containing protein [Cladorrhinum samala]|uniref:GNAT domain-containing protein n=1 Tax=Cladorrhinum samala TaxID=585594 RepID=A0AAV9HQW0_9PEZI|nr:GNAT domain-containing protein [Cladorrhinum samala]